VWRDVAARLVEIILAIENIDGWAIRPEKVQAPPPSHGSALEP
jgi:hypothetical protein